MIKIVHGDLLKSKEDIVVHQVNCKGIMGSGVAKQIKDKYPEVYKEYIEAINSCMEDEDSTKDLLGKAQFVNVDHDRYVVNLFSQYGFGYDNKQYTEIKYMLEGLKKVKNIAKKYNLSVAMPYMIGSCRGGADWKEVENLILTAFNDYQVTLYKLDRG